MKKFLKIFAIAAIAVAAAIACVLAGCNNGDKDSYTKSDYNFTVVYVGGEKDGKPVNGKSDGVNGAVGVQICEPDQACYPVDNVKIDSKGRISFSQEQVDEILGKTGVTVFVFHVMGVKDYKSDCEVTTTDGKGDYEVKVTLN